MTTRKKPQQPTEMEKALALIHSQIEGKLAEIERLQVEIDALQGLLAAFQGLQQLELGKNRRVQGGDSD